ncbi:MAG: DNA polymerase [Terrimicrobiaceae bacterium]
MDAETFNRLQKNWDQIKIHLIASVDTDFGVYEDGTFKEARWQNYCSERGIHWPPLLSGRLDMKDETFRMMADLHPQIQPIRELRATLSQLKLNKLTVGRDHRNRYIQGAFGSLTGRNQPSNQKGIFGPATWVRNLIKPVTGMAVAYLDYEQQEFGIAAALSGDEKMIAAYSSGDPYLEFAKQAGLVPKDATKKSHPNERDLCKATTLAVQYGMGAKALGIKIGQTEQHGRALLQQHRAAYATFWRWSDSLESRGMMGKPLETVLGWRTFGRIPPNPRTFRNFPAQANGAEILRVAMIALVESGISVCAPVHDAVLIEAPLVEIDQTVEVSRAIMEAASSAVLNGFTIRTDCKIVRHPDRYSDPRGKQVWERISEILEALEKQNAQNPGNEVRQK